MAPGGSINFASRRYAEQQTADATIALRKRVPVVFGAMVALPISLLLWVAIIVGLRSLL